VAAHLGLDEADADDDGAPAATSASAWAGVMPARSKTAEYIGRVRTIRLHDTRSAAVRDLEPREPGRVGIYACGPTVYNRIHVGNARPFVVFSQLKRYLQHEGFDVTLVANVTDVNDKIYDAARPLGVPSADLAAEMTAAYVRDTDGLELGRPDAEPLASETIDGIVALIQALIDSGHAYAVDGDVYFRVRTDPQYGSLSHRSVDDMDQGEGVEGGERKEDPLDFALWKAQKEGEDTAWDTPWGRGRPGWHIECSAMAEGLLGVDFEIHGGGSDLMFPHHENEAAQTRSARGAELARIWMHNGMLQLGGEKMAKSVGNIESLADALERWGRDALLLLFSQSHYRQPMQYSDETLAAAQAGVRRIREAGRQLVSGPSPEDMAPLRERFFAALADDFNTPEALGAVWEWVRESNRRGGVGDADLREMLGVLGLDNLLDAGGGEGEPDEDARDLLSRREQARAARDWAEADRLRDELSARGWQVRDSPAGPELVPGKR
jgi:cysteinyl-tRNA synthetase